MPRIGAHLSVSPLKAEAALNRRAVKGPAGAIVRAMELGCQTVQLFLRQNRQWRTPKLSEKDVAAFHKVAADAAEGRWCDAIYNSPPDEQALADAAEGFRPPAADRRVAPLISHASYLINLGSPPGVISYGRDVRQMSISALDDELTLAARLGVQYVVLHPGSHMGAGDEAALKLIIEALDEVIARHGDDNVSVLVETTSGQGSAVGYRLEHLGTILAGSAHRERLGVCCDTCHMFSAGYDFRTQAAYDDTLGELDRHVGLENVRLWHLNDTAKPFGSRVDRHTQIGRGHLGNETFARLLNDPRWADRPMVIETPKKGLHDEPMDPVNLATLWSLLKSE